MCGWVGGCVFDKGNYPEKLLVLFCPNKKRSFEPFICLDQISESTSSGLDYIALCTHGRRRGAGRGWGVGAIPF